MDREELFQIQSELMFQATKLFEDYSNRVEDEAKKARIVDKGESEMETTINIFKVRSLRQFRDTLKHLAGEVLRPEPGRHVFLLPNVRTLLDIYRRFLHLQRNCKDKEQQGFCCLAYQLLISKTLNREDEYRHVLKLHENFLKKSGGTFPERLEDFSFTWIRKGGFMFGQTDDLLTEENIKTLSPDASSIFGAKKSLEIYSYLSEALHGNPWQYMGKPHNERFWVVAMSLSTSAFLLELVDRYTFKREHPRNFRIWLNNVQKSKPVFLSLWRLESQKRTEKDH